MEILRPYISECLISSSAIGYHEEKVETESGIKNFLILEGEFQHANKPNKNKRIYENSLLSRETKKLHEIIENRNGLPGGLDHPIPNPNDPPQAQMQAIRRISMENACLLIKHLEMNGDVVYGKARVLSGDNGTGDKLAAFVKNGFKPGISSRGLGGDPVMRGEHFIVPESFQMITYDAVSDPSTHNAILEQAIQEEFYLYEQSHKHVKKLYEVLINLSNK